MEGPTDKVLDSDAFRATMTGEADERMERMSSSYA
jgi:hypothetical protein